MTDTYNLDHSGSDVDNAIDKVQAHISPIDTTVTAGSTAAVTSGAIKTELNTLQSNIDTLSNAFPGSARNVTEYLGTDRNSGVIFQNLTGGPIFVTWSANVTPIQNEFISYVLLEMATTQQNLTDGVDQTIAQAGGEGRAHVCGIIPHNRFWRVRYSATADLQNLYYINFRLA